MSDLSLDDLDKLAAMKIMGLDEKVLLILEGSLRHPGEKWQPTRNIAQAFELLAKLNHTAIVNYIPSNSSSCVIYSGVRMGSVSSIAKTTPEAITQTCLKAVGAI